MGDDAYDTSREVPPVLGLARLRARILSLSRIAAVAVTLIGVGTLAGWWFGVPALVHVGRATVPMMPNTALALVLGGAAVLLDRPCASRIRRAAISVHGAAVLLVGVGALLEYALAVDIGLDHLLLPSARGTSLRAATVTAVDLTLLGGAILFRNAPRRAPDMISQICALAAITVTVPSLIGYLYGAPSLYHFEGQIPIAAHTAASMLLFGVAILAAHPDRWLVGIATGDTITGSTMRRLAPPTLLLPLVITWLALHAERAALIGTATGASLSAALIGGAFLVLLFRHGALLMRSEVALRRQADILQQAHDAIIVRDVDGLITYWNRSAELLYGWPEAVAIGCSRHMLLAPRGGGETGALDATILLRGRWEGELQQNTRDGRAIIVESRQSVLRDGGRPSSILEANRDVTERARVEKARRDTAERLRAIVVNAIDGIIIIDEHGIIESWNPAAERIFGYSVDEVAGRRIEMLMPEPYRSEHAGYLAHYLATGERHIIGIGREVRGQRKDGSVFPMDLAVSEALLGDRRIFTGTVRDITERRRVEAERDSLLESERAARTEAQRAARMKDDFLSTVSHELRTPLNAILGWSRMLASGTLDAAKAARALEVIDRNAQAQARLIEDLLDVSRISTGTLRLDLQTVDLARACDNAAATLQPEADAKHVAVDRTQPAEPCAARGDSGRIEQVIRNLLSNAIKFTPRGGRVRVDVRCAGWDAEVAVRDAGIGITAEFLPHVFERFRQADASTTRAHGGLGLGLAIVRHVVEMHGGSVTAASAGEGRGATFTVTLPRASMKQDAAGAPPTGDTISLGGVKVLVVDDEADVRDLMRSILEARDADVVAAASAAAALEELDRLLPDVLLSDIGMPGQDGYQLIRAVRARPHERGGDVPAAAVTAFARPEDVRLALLAGYQAHVAKPVDGTALVRVVAQLRAEPTEPQAG